MDYENILEMPDETRQIILKAIEIYAAIKDENLFCAQPEAGERGNRKELANSDKKVASLFLASLIVESDAKKLMSEYEITAEKIFDYLGIEKECIQSLDDDIYEQYYSEYFKLILFAIKKQMAGRLNVTSKSFFPEIIPCVTTDIDLMGSKVLNWIYRENKWDNLIASSHISIKMMRISLEEKLAKAKVEQPKIFSDSFRENLDISLQGKTMLDKYGVYLTDKEYTTNPAIGREAELRNLMVALLTPEKSPILVGPAGTGKTGMVEGLSYLIQLKQVPKRLENMRIVKINTSTIVAGCSYVGMLEERVEQLVKELQDDLNTILFIDEIHTAMGAGSSSKSNMDVSNMLKPYLDRGQIKIIGATTNEEYEKYIVPATAFKRRFEKINLNEPEKDVVIQILHGTIPKLEKITEVKFDFNSGETVAILELITSLSDKKHRAFNDVEYNPALALSILAKSFAFAALESRESVQIEDIVSSISACERINQIARNEYSKRIVEEFKKNNDNLDSKVVGIETLKRGRK